MCAIWFIVRATDWPLSAPRSCACGPGPPAPRGDELVPPAPARVEREWQATN